MNEKKVYGVIDIIRYLLIFFDFKLKTISNKYEIILLTRIIFLEKILKFSF